MAKQISYKKLILKIILLTLIITLTIGFVYGQYMKKDAIENLTKVDARKTTQLIFQSLYSAMEKGWNREDIEKIIQRVNNIEKNLSVNVYRTDTVAKQFGDIKDSKEARENNSFVKKAIKNQELLNIIDDVSIDYYYPITAKKECLKCHTQAKEKDVLGVINIAYPIDDLKVSLSTIINFFLIFITVFSIVIFVALYTEFDKYLVIPIKTFIKNIDTISKNKDIKKRVEFEHNIEEINSMKEVFNMMLDSIEYQFYNDELTSLPNRKRLLETLSTNDNAILMIINIDNFQQINDLYGDKSGDEVLKTASERLIAALPEEAELYKLHADEYAIYYKKDLEQEDIKSLANFLNYCIEKETFIINDSEIFINATIGVSYGKALLLNYSDIALKLAKKKKQKYLIYESSMQIESEYEQNIKWTKKIKDAIASDKIEPLFQPIVNAQTKEIVKYEALMRMVDDNGDYIAPMHFLELAKKNKLYPELTKIMIEKTFEKFKNSNLQVSINISVEDILNESVHKLILEKLYEYKKGDRIVFELLESEGIENFDEVIKFIKEVKETGAKISIDDFGTGYSNFEYLMKLNVDYIKIDASMIKNIDKNINSQKVTETIITFANKMNIETIAEFIHSENVYNTVKAMGITYAQGYYFGEPRPLD
jgi:c-di-GMP phosphodiesterase